MTKLETFAKALKKAKKLAKEGPRVAAILRRGSSYQALPGYVDSNEELPEGVSQDYLVTPDGRVWEAW